MNRDFLTDELLEAAVKKACEAEYSSLGNVEEHEFSPEFEQKMKELVEENKPIPFRRKRKIKMRYLLVAVISFVLSYATVIAVEPAQEKIAEYLQKVSETDKPYKMVEEIPNGVVFNPKHIKYLPKGITAAGTKNYHAIDEEYAILECEYKGDNGASLIYVNATPAYWDIYESDMEWENAIVQEIFVDGFPAILIIEQNGRENIIYIKGGQVFYVSGTVGRAELVKVLESIEW